LVVAVGAALEALISLYAACDDVHPVSDLICFLVVYTYCLFIMAHLRISQNCMPY